MNPVKILNGNFILKDSSYIFIKCGKEVKAIKSNKKQPYERVVFCDRCGAVPAIQLDSQYSKGIHDFTLCGFCLQDLENIDI